VLLVQQQRALTGQRLSALLVQSRPRLPGFFENRLAVLVGVLTGLTRKPLIQFVEVPERAVNLGVLIQLRWPPAGIAGGVIVPLERRRIPWPSARPAVEPTPARPVDRALPALTAAPRRRITSARRRAVGRRLLVGH